MSKTKNFKLTDTIKEQFEIIKKTADRHNEIQAEIVGMRETIDTCWGNIRNELIQSGEITYNEIQKGSLTIKDNKVVLTLEK